MSTILAIESSCDDTAAAVIHNGKILSNVISSQLQHNAYGGVIPEVASRVHIQNIAFVVNEALTIAQIQKSELDAIAFTNGPGLLGPLLVGSTFAKALSVGLNKPLIAVDHMQAHIASVLIAENRPTFPFLCLTVSGGHTQIVKVNSLGNLEILGHTLDDAAGEAFDKAAKIMKLGYPGGPLIDKIAKNGNPLAFPLPIPQVKNFDFSFSGLKTAFLYLVQNKTKEDANFIENNLADLCASFQYTVVKVLTKKFYKAAKENNIIQLGVAGGVSANSALREELNTLSIKHNFKVFFPALEHTTDNAAMIAKVAEWKFEMQEFSSLDSIPSARLKF